MTLHEKLTAAVEEPWHIWAPSPAARPLSDQHVALKSVVELHHDFDGRCVSCIEFCDCIERDDEARVADCTHGNVPYPCMTIRRIALALGIETGDQTP